MPEDVAVRPVFNDRLTTSDSREGGLPVDRLAFFVGHNNLRLLVAANSQPRWRGPLAETKRLAYYRLGDSIPIGGIVNLDFAGVLRTIAAFFRAEKYPFALIGAFGLHAYGLSRATRDLDFATDAAAQDKLIGFLESLRYTTLHRSAGYSTHCHKDESFGRLDFVYVSGDTSRRLFGEMEGRFEIEGLEVPVPRPEHLAAMKVQAIKNDPSRTLQDLADIRFLLSLPGIDEAEVRNYFEKGGLLSLYEEIKRKI